MLTSIDISNQGRAITLSIVDVVDGYVIEEIGGLDPVRANIVTSGLANIDGSNFQAARRTERNITFKIALIPDYSSNDVQTLRRQLYTYFSPKTAVYMVFNDDTGLSVGISGRVESFETALFTREPSVNISIICFDPDFVDVDKTTVNGVSTSTSTVTPHTYLGTVPTGFTFTTTVNQALTALTFSNSAQGVPSQQLSLNVALATNDLVTMITTPGSKKITRKVAATNVSSSVLYGVTPQSLWPSLYYGTNNLRLYAAATTAFAWKIEYYARYGGL